MYFKREFKNLYRLFPADDGFNLEIGDDKCLFLGTAISGNFSDEKSASVAVAVIEDILGAIDSFLNNAKLNYSDGDDTELYADLYRKNMSKQLKYLRTHEINGNACPICGSALIKHKDDLFGDYWKCTSYFCKAKFDDKNGSPDFDTDK